MTLLAKILVSTNTKTGKSVFFRKKAGDSIESPGESGDFLDFSF